AAALSKSLARIGPAPEPLPELGPAEPNVPTLADDRSLLDQLTFLQKVSTDISKITDVLAK
ncbi:hypothetical protein, partial [Hymenobacter agri]